MNEIVRPFFLVFVANVIPVRHSSRVAYCHWFTGNDLDIYRRIDTGV